MFNCAELKNPSSRRKSITWRRPSWLMTLFGWGRSSHRFLMSSRRRWGHRSRRMHVYHGFKLPAKVFSGRAIDTTFSGL
jgi:hypothetical protein